jgi:hypothetical protein
MKLHVRSAGGIGGLRIEGALDTGELPPALAAQALSLVDLAERRGPPPPADPARGMADALEYDLTWFREDEAGHEVARSCRWSQATAPPEALDALEALMREVVRRKAAAARGGDPTAR